MKDVRSGVPFTADGRPSSCLELDQDRETTAGRRPRLRERLCGEINLAHARTGALLNRLLDHVCKRGCPTDSLDLLVALHGPGLLELPLQIHPGADAHPSAQRVAHCSRQRPRLPAEPLDARPKQAGQGVHQFGQLVDLVEIRVAPDDLDLNRGFAGIRPVVVWEQEHGIPVGPGDAEGGVERVGAVAGPHLPPRPVTCRLGDARDRRQNRRFDPSARECGADRAHRTRYPPSTTSTSPWRYAAAGELRKATASATSCGRAQRPSGIRPVISA